MDPVSVNMMRISTRDLPEHNRIATICELYGRTILKHDIEPIGDQPFEFESEFSTACRASGSRRPSSGRAGRRADRTHIDSDDLVLSVMLQPAAASCTPTRRAKRQSSEGQARFDCHRVHRRRHD